MGRKFRMALEDKLNTSCHVDILYTCVRYRHVDVCPADVCEDGHFPGDAVQEVWETL